MPSATSSTFAFVIVLEEVQAGSANATKTARLSTRKTRTIFSGGLRITIISSVAFAHNEVQTAEHGHDVAERTAGQKFGQDTEIHKRGGANLQSVRDTAAFAVDVETELALWVLGAEINLARRRVEAFRHDDEMVDQFFHLGHDPRFGRRHIFPIDDVDRTGRQFLDDLSKDPRALPHLFQAHQVTIVTIAGTANDDFEIVFLVVDVGMLAAQIVFDPAPAQVGTGKGVSDRAITRDHADVAGAIHEDAVPGQQFVHFVELRDEVVEKFLKRRDEGVRQITDLAADARVGRSEARPSEELEQVIELFALGERVEKRRHRAEIEGHGAEAEQM